MSHSNTSDATQDTRAGCLPAVAAWLFGPQAQRLREQASRTHWLSYLLIISQSIAVVLVFGHAEVPLLLTPNIAIRALALMVLFVLIITVIAADIALLETLARVPALARNRQRGAMWEHVAYVVFVLATEGSTYAVVLAAIDSDPQVLTRTTALIPTAGPLFAALVILRVLLICWSAVQLIIVRGKLPVLLSTLTNTGKEIVGAHVERQLAGLDIGDVALPDTFAVYAAMAKPPRPIRGVLNGWLVRRALAQEAEEERQVGNVLAALESLEARRAWAMPTPELPPDLPPAGPPDDGGSDHRSHHATQGGSDHRSYAPPTLIPSGVAPYNVSSLPPVAQMTAPTHEASAAPPRKPGRKSSGKRGGKSGGKSVGKSTGKRMLTYAKRDHQRMLEVRGWLAAGEAVSQQRIRKAFGVSNDAAKRLLAEARQRALYVVGE